MTLKKAEKYANKVLELKPDSPDVAEKLARKLLEIDPLNPINYALLGFALWMRGDFNQAISAFRKCEKLEPESIIAKFWIVIILGWKKEFKKAFEMIDQLVKTESQDIMHVTFCEMLSAFKYAWQGDPKKALSILTDDVKNYTWKDPDFPWKKLLNGLTML